MTVINSVSNIVGQVISGVGNITDFGHIKTGKGFWEVGRTSHLFFGGKNGPFFSSFNGKCSFDIFVVTLQKHFAYDSSLKIMILAQN